MIKLRWKNEWINFISVEWSGTANQCSRQLQFDLPSNPYDTNFEQANIALGDLVYLYDGSKQLFVGTVTNKERTASPGSASYTAKDFMHHLLRSSGTYKLKNKTPEKITKQLCTDLKIQTGTLAKTNTHIQKMYFEDQSIYDIIIAVYRKAKANTGKNYLPVMAGKKVSVIEKGQPCGAKLTQGIDITDATYTRTTDNMVNLVKIYNSKRKKLGQVQNKKHTSKYGIYQKVYQKEKGVNAKKKAKAMMEGITREASVEAIGDVRAISGYAIDIQDRATGLSGKFYITSDTHTFQDGAHTMSLELAWKEEMEEGADAAVYKAGKKKITNASKAFYLAGSSVYHSSDSCSACKGKELKKSTVVALKKVRITQGKNKGKRKYKPCSKCWIT